MDIRSTGSRYQKLFFPSYSNTLNRGKFTVVITSQNFVQKNINFPRGYSRLDLKSRNASISERHNWLKPIDMLMVYISIFTLIHTFSI